MQCRFSILQYLLLQNTFFLVSSLHLTFSIKFSCRARRALQNGISGSITRVLVWGKDANSVVTYKSSVRITELPLRWLRDYDPMEYSTNLVSLYLNICKIRSNVYCILWSVCICIYIYISLQVRRFSKTRSFVKDQVLLDLFVRLKFQPSSDKSSNYCMLQPPQSWKTGALEIHGTFTVDSQFLRVFWSFWWSLTKRITVDSR